MCRTKTPCPQTAQLAHWCNRVPAPAPSSRFPPSRRVELRPAPRVPRIGVESSAWRACAARKGSMHVDVVTCRSACSARDSKPWLTSTLIAWCQMECAHVSEGHAVASGQLRGRDSHARTWAFIMSDHRTVHVHVWPSTWVAMHMQSAMQQTACGFDHHQSICGTPINTGMSPKRRGQHVKRLTCSRATEHKQARDKAKRPHL
jgi:hypothetical protein